MNKHTSKRLLSLLLTISMVLSLSLSFITPAFAAEGDKFTFQIIHTNDLHGSFSHWRYSAGVNGAGLTRMATQINTWRGQNPNTILIDVGDTIQGNGTGIFHSPVWDDDPLNTTKMYPALYGMEMLGYDAWVLGNHEFNFGIDRLYKAFGKDRDGTGKHGFSGAVLSGNVYAGEGNPYGLPVDSRVFDAFFVKSFENGPTVAIISMTHPDIVQWDYGYVVDQAKFYTNSPATETQKTIAYLKSTEAEAIYGKIDVFVAAQHMGSGDASSVIRANPELDLFIGGHAHSNANSMNNGVRYVENSGNGGQIGRIDVTVTQQADGSWKVANRTNDTASTKVSISSSTAVNAAYQNNPAMSHMHDAAYAQSQQVVGTLSGGPLVAGTVVRGSGNNFYTFDSALTHLFHDAFQYFGTEYVKKDPVLSARFGAVTLSASCPLNTSANPPVGPLTRATIGQLYQYDNNTLCVIELTGHQVKMLAEYGYSSGNAATATANNFFPTGNASNSYDRIMIDGLNYKVDSTRSAWNRVYDLRNADGTPFDLDGVYLMAANNHTTGSRFFASGSSYPLSRLLTQPDSTKLRDAEGNLVDSDFGPGMPLVHTWTADEFLTVNGDTINNPDGCTGVVADYILRVLGGNLTNQFTPNWRYDTTTAIPSSDWVLYNKAVQVVNANIGTNLNQATPGNIRAQLQPYAQPLWDTYLECLSLVKADYDAAKWAAFTDAKAAAGQVLLDSGYTGNAGTATQSQVEAALSSLEDAIEALAAEPEPQGPQEGDVEEITVFFTSDLHGGYWNCNFATVNPDTGNHDNITGLPRVASALKSKQNALKADGKSWLTLDVGDTIEGKGTSCFIGNNDFTNPMMKAFNYLGYDAFIPGNHEFNYGVPNLYDIVNGNGPKNVGFNGALLMGNAFQYTGEPEDWPPPDSQIDGTDKLLEGFKAYEIFDCNGVKVAVIGMTAPGSDTWDAIKLKTANVYTESAIGATVRAIHEIKDAPGGPLADVIVLAAHMSTGNTFNRPGSGASSVLANSYIAQNVDVFLGAHGHSRTSSTINGVRYGENGADGNSYGEVKIMATYNSGKWGVRSKTNDVSVTMNTLSTSSAQEVDYLLHLQPEYEFNEDSIRAPIGTLINGRMNDSALKGSGNYSPAYIEPTKMVEFIHDVQKYFANAEISVACPFSTSMQHLEGPISRGSLGGIYRYDSNTVYRLEMKGWQVKKFMEFVVQNYYNKPTTAQLTTDLSPTHATSYNTDNLGGVRYTVDLTAANGSRVNITEVKRLSGEWQAYDPNETYIVAANDYRSSSRILSPTSGVFTQAELDAPDAPKILEIDCTRGHETAPDIISLMAYYVGLQGEVIDAADYERNWSIVPWWETTIPNGKYLREQGERLTQEGKITNVTGSNALKAAAVIAALAAEPKHVASVTVSELTAIEGLAEFMLYLKNLDHVNTISFDLTLTGRNLEYDKVVSLGEFTAMPVIWTEAEDGSYRTNLTLVCMGGTVTTANALEVAKMFFYAPKLGDATLTISKVTVTMQPVAGGEITVAEGIIEKGSATTSVVKFYSIYDVNKDDKIDVEDLAIVALACGARFGDPRWNQVVATSGGRAIYAYMCDVNGDGEVDMMDLLDVFLNYT